MKDKEVLQKAIKIATRKNGTFQYISVFNEKIETSIGDSQMPIVCFNFPEFKKSIECSYEKLIFSHDFAKAFWGEEKHLENQFDIIDNCACGELTYHYYQTYEDGMVRNCTEYCWQYHLQQMVLEQNPIDYLRKFIES